MLTVLAVEEQGRVASISPAVSSIKHTDQSLLIALMLVWSLVSMCHRGCSQGRWDRSYQCRHRMCHLAWVTADGTRPQLKPDLLLWSLGK